MTTLAKQNLLSPAAQLRVGSGWSRRGGQEGCRQVRPEVALVWAPEDSSSYLKCQQQEERFNAVETTIHKVPHEEVVGLRDVATHLRGGKRS